MWRYTDEQIEYLREIGHQTDRSNEEITEMFNKKFNKDKTRTAIAAVKNKNKISSFTGSKPYTKEQIEYIRSIASTRTNKEITEMFNVKYDDNRTGIGIACIRYKNDITTGSTGRFIEGEKPPNWVELGSERITKDGYIQIKIRDGKLQQNWRGKHILVWEEVNGSLPEGHAIIFGDGDMRNFDIDNLICVSRKQLLGLNRHDLIQDDAEITRTAVNIVDLQYKLNERSS